MKEMCGADVFGKYRRCRVDKQGKRLRSHSRYDEVLVGTTSEFVSHFRYFRATISPSLEKPQTTENVLEAKLHSLEAEIVSAGLAPAECMPTFQKYLLATPDPERALNNLLRYIASGFTSSILRGFYENPVLLKIALTLFSHSQYLADILVRNPELFHWLTATTALTDARTQEDFNRDALSAIAPFERIEKKLDALKRYQRREILKISTRDILKEADLATITSELSWLADSVIAAVVEIGVGDLNRRLAGDVPSTFSVVGLGKLGGAELNFSSDIDLMFVYDADGELEYPVERIYSYHEYYCRLAEFVVRRLSEHTNEGHLYRVDMRLRPEGGVGALALSREAYLRYYESRGELWERQMLLKARIVAGNKSVGERFLADLRPFVYPSTTVLDPREEIRLIKKRIEAGSPGKSNVKLSKGGIRDVEFIVQALQMVRSSARNELRESNTLLAIEKLSRASMFSRKESQQLRQGYEFLRHVEHRLQLLHGTQTHELPASEEEFRLLGNRMGFKSSRTFRKELDRIQTQIREVYDNVFLEEKSENKGPSARNRISSVPLSRVLSKAGAIDTRRAVESVERIRRNLVQLEEPTAFDRLLGLLRRHGALDSGLRNFSLLSSLQPLVRTMDQVMTNERMLDLLVTICSRSNKLSQQLSQQPLLLESLLGRTEDFFKRGVEWKFLLKSDPFRFRVFNEFKTLVSYLLGSISIQEASREFSLIADTVVVSIIEDLVPKFPGFTDEACIVALGKYGGEEILVGSDLDLMILAREKGGLGPTVDVQKGSVEFVRSFSSDSGQVYDVDLRLRPEGKNSPLVAGFSYYEQYLNDRAELWEQQALLKARVLFGAHDLSHRFETLRSSALARVDRKAGWLNSMRAMKTRMESERTDEKTRKTDLKIGKGGLVDLEFLVQALQLKSCSAVEAITVANSFAAIDQIKSSRLLAKTHWKILERNYRFLRELELSVRLNSELNKFVLPDEQVLLQVVAASVGTLSSKELRKRISLVRRENNLLLKSVFAAMKR